MPKRTKLWVDPFSSTNKFVYDGWNLVAELKPGNSPIRTYMWGTDLSGTPQGAGGVGGLLEAGYYGAATTNCFPAFDGNGNVMAYISAADGTLAASYEYGPFGEVIRQSGPIAKLNPFRFSTKYDDDETDLLYYGYRYYNPSTGRWLSRDPAEEEGGLNLYVFLKNDSTDQTDFIGFGVNDPPPISIPLGVFVEDGVKWAYSGWLPGPGLGGANSLKVTLSGLTNCGCLNNVILTPIMTTRTGWSVTSDKSDTTKTLCSSGNPRCYTYTESISWVSAPLKIPSWIPFKDTQSISVTVSICGDGTVSKSDSSSQTGWQAGDYFTAQHF
jgi:RHS repeat-associated protein